MLSYLSHLRKITRQRVSMKKLAVFAILYSTLIMVPIVSMEYNNPLSRLHASLNRIFEPYRKEHKLTNIQIFKLLEQSRAEIDQELVKNIGDPFSKYYNEADIGDTTSDLIGRLIGFQVTLNNGLFYSVSQNNKTKVSEHLQMGADPNAMFKVPNKDQSSSLSFAIKRCRKETSYALVIQELLGFGADTKQLLEQDQKFLIEKGFIKDN